MASQYKVISGAIPATLVGNVVEFNFKLQPSPSGRPGVLFYTIDTDGGRGYRIQRQNGQGRRSRISATSTPFHYVTYQG